MLTLLLSNWKNVLLISSVVASVLLFMRVCNRESEMDRLCSNQTALLDSANQYKTKSGALASEVMSLNLTRSEMELSNNKEITRLNSVIDDLKIKKKNATQGTTASTSSSTSGNVRLVDRYIYDTVTDTVVKVKGGTFCDPWTKLDLIVIDTTVKFSIETKDTIDIIFNKKKVGGWKVKNLFVWRDVVYFANAKASRPNSTIKVFNVYMEKQQKR